MSFQRNLKLTLTKIKENWKNVNLSDFLESMIAYAEDTQGFYDNMVMKINSGNPTWKNSSHILKGASIYE